MEQSEIFYRRVIIGIGIKSNNDKFRSFDKTYSVMIVIRIGSYINLTEVVVKLSTRSDSLQLGQMGRALS